MKPSSTVRLTNPGIRARRRTGSRGRPGAAPRGRPVRTPWA